MSESSVISRDGFILQLPTLSPIFRSGFVLILFLRRTEDSAAQAVTFFVALRVLQFAAACNLLVLSFSISPPKKKVIASAPRGDG
jgi:hypothetical protein